MNSQQKLIPPETKTFTLSYDSLENNLQNHRMSADNLSLIVKGMNDLLQKSDQIINGENHSLELFVQAPAKIGSFGIEFVVEIFQPDNALKVLLALGFVATTVQNTFQVAKEFVNQTIFDIVDIENSDEVVIQTNGKAIESHKDIAQLIAHPEIREIIKKIVTVPLENHDKPSFKIIRHASNEEKILLDDSEFCLQANEIEAIQKLNTDRKETETLHFERIIRFTTVNFEGNKGWKIILDGKEVVVTIEDEEFLMQIFKASLSFKATDKYNVAIKQTIRYDNKCSKEKVTYSLTKVTRTNV